MATISELLDHAKARRRIPSDSALAVRIGKSRQTISQWRSGTRVPEDDQVIALANLAEADTGPWLVLAQTSRSTPAAALEWSKIAKRVGIAAAITLCLFTLRENALFSGVSTSELPANAYYVK